LIKRNRTKRSRALQCCTKPETTVCISLLLIKCRYIYHKHVCRSENRDIPAGQSSIFYHDNGSRRRSFFYSLFMMCFLHSCLLLHLLCWCNNVATVGAMIRREHRKKSSQFSSCVSHSMCITNVIAALQHCLHSIHFIERVNFHHS
jgi:hypothetical protein